jgi:hypothetical protein
VRTQTPPDKVDSGYYCNPLICADCKWTYDFCVCNSDDATDTHCDVCIKKHTIKVGDIYKHRKGNLYRIDAVAKHSETLEYMVVYTALYDNPDGKIWTRPLHSFLDPERFTLCQTT